MKKYKKQHFVPCGYLQYFSITGDYSKGRSTRVYFSDGEKCLTQTVNNLAASNYTYSRIEPEFDKTFHDIEKNYSKVVRKILNSESVNSLEWLYLVFMIVDLHSRNISYENTTGSERKESYNAVSIGILELIFGELLKNFDPVEAGKYLTKNWAIALLKPVNENEDFITSDNPSIGISLEGDDRPVLFFLPVHPRILLVLYFRPSINVSSLRITDSDLSNLNGMQVDLSNRHIFSSKNLALKDNTWQSIKVLMSKKTKSNGAFLGKKRWVPNILVFKKENIEKYSFINVTKPS